MIRLRKKRGKGGGILGYNTIELIERVVEHNGKWKGRVHWIAICDGDLSIIVQGDLDCSTHEYTATYVGGFK